MQPSETNYYSSLFLASRPKTLVASVLPVVLGSHLAFTQSSSIDIVLLSSIILSVLCIQVATNFFNDSLDNLKGADNADRIGPKRMVSSGQIPSQSLIIAGITFVVMAITFSLPIVAARGLPIIFIGIISLILSYCYTGGPWPLAYKGLGELFVFLFFGLLSVLGSYFLFTKEIYFLLTLPAISIGLLSTAVLNLNNMRDYQNDKKSNKNTIVVKIGLKAAKRYHYSLLLLSFISAVSYVVLTFTKTVQFIFLLAYIPLVIHALFVYNNKEELRLDAELKKVALSTFLFSVLLGLGQVL